MIKNFFKGKAILFTQYFWSLTLTTRSPTPTWGQRDFILFAIISFKNNDGIGPKIPSRIYFSWAVSYSIGLFWRNNPWRITSGHGFKRIPSDNDINTSTGAHLPREACGAHAALGTEPQSSSPGGTCQRGFQGEARKLAKERDPGQRCFTVVRHTGKS